MIFGELWSKQNKEKIVKIKEDVSFLSPKRSELFWDILTKWNISEDELLKQPLFSKSVPKEYDLKLPQNLKNIVKRITFISIGSSKGPSIDITDAIWFADPIEKQIKKKLKKKI